LECGRSTHGFTSIEHSRKVWKILLNIREPPKSVPEKCSGKEEEKRKLAIRQTDKGKDMVTIQKDSNRSFLSSMELSPDIR
jgi:hypothetical protein